ncbi:O-methyltransferase family 3 [Caldalkalibacillus thermarum TA2.A1]|uniref:tRNA 5-hydroxyuridine methyltransferase n=1 Tax=Caldalkalibacillus thermarum (strain TA2.A1) TaxID=986075 RepID=F5L571_CALTT|nr:O-methyltransferase [Caldalkalibacillus thermarum]EGL83501.1 O-methyltransferase family 3 [Caldalkalibacillus thermarum TA2.A1]QZT33458.1 O-methyltransferase [Caldalkalibacillus thermarum TA2.A1]
MLVDPRLTQYLRQLTPLGHPVLAEMEEHAAREGIPIIDRASIQLISILLQTKANVERVLEIGTAIGYSAIWMAEAVPGAHIDTIERDEQRVRQARAYIARAGLAERITVHHADAKDNPPSLSEHYDCIFIDAAKGQYRFFFERYGTRLKPGGLIISDNVLFRGHVVHNHVENKRLTPLVQKLQAYNKWLADHPRFETSFVPVGDGLAISRLKTKPSEN